MSPGRRPRGREAGGFLTQAQKRKRIPIIPRARARPPPQRPPGPNGQWANDKQQPSSPLLSTAAPPGRGTARAGQRCTGRSRSRSPAALGGSGLRSCSRFFVVLPVLGSLCLCLASGPGPWI
jgi:hypothetical protein